MVELTPEAEAALARTQHTFSGGMYLFGLFTTSVVLGTSIALRLPKTYYFPTWVKAWLVAHSLVTFLVLAWDSTFEHPFWEHYNAKVIHLPELPGWHPDKMFDPLGSAHGAVNMAEIALNVLALSLLCAGKAKAAAASTILVSISSVVKTVMCVPPQPDEPMCVSVRFLVNPQHALMVYLAPNGALIWVPVAAVLHLLVRLTSEEEEYDPDEAYESTWKED